MTVYVTTAWGSIIAAAIFLVVALASRPERRIDRIATRIAGVAFFSDIAFQLQPVFDAFGGSPWVVLAQQVSCVTAIAALCIMIGGTGATAPSDKAIFVVWIAAVILQVVVFAAWPPTGAQNPYLDPVALYLPNVVFMSISWTAMALLAVIGIYASWREIAARRSSELVWGLALTGLGALLALVAAVLHFLIALGFTTSDELRPSMLLTINFAAILIAAGLCVPAITQGVSTRYRLWQVGGIWLRVDASKSPLTAIKALPRSRHILSAQPGHLLLRRAVEADEARRHVGARRLSKRETDILNGVLARFGIRE